MLVVSALACRHNAGFLGPIPVLLMTGDPSQARKPYEHAPYASLRAPERASQGQSDPLGSTHEAAANEMQSEAERLRALREALWAAFDAGPAAGLPNVLIDLTMAYTSSLRLQLSLKALSTRGPAAKSRAAAPSSNHARGKP